MDCLERIFYFLSNADIVNCSQVNSFWRDIALRVLVRRLRLYQHVKIHSCTNDFTSLFNKIQIVCLDLTEMDLPESDHFLIPSQHRTNAKFWNTFSRNIKNLINLRTLKLRSCPSTVIVNLSESNPLLKKLKALSIKGPDIDLSYLIRFKYLIKLYLQYKKGIRFFYEDYCVTNENLPNLLQLTIVGAARLNVSNIMRAANVNCLRSLSLGNCTAIPEEFATSTLKCLYRLEKLRLEKYRGLGIVTIFYTVGTMENLKHLEVTDIDVPDGIDEAIATCRNLRKLLIASHPNSSSPGNNRKILCGIVKLRNNLIEFEWIFSVGLYLTSCHYIPILNDLPVLDSCNKVFIPPLKEPEENTNFDINTLKIFIKFFLPNCTIKIQHEAHLRTYLYNWLPILN